MLTKVICISRAWKIIFSGVEITHTGPAIIIYETVLLFRFEYRGIIIFLRWSMFFFLENTFVLKYTNRNSTLPIFFLKIHPSMEKYPAVSKTEYDTFHSSPQPLANEKYQNLTNNLTTRRSNIVPSPKMFIFCSFLQTEGPRGLGGSRRLRQTKTTQEVAQCSLPLAGLEKMFI